MITFICGVPCSGKTTYRQKHFPDVPCVDIIEFQRHLKIRTKENVLRTYEQTIEKTLEMAKDGDVIVEQTALRQIRRLNAVKALRDGGYEGEIHLIFLAPSRMEIMGRAMNRFKDDDCTDQQIVSYMDAHLDVLELPAQDEPFTSIKIIEE